MENWKDHRNFILVRRKWHFHRLSCEWALEYWVSLQPLSVPTATPEQYLTRLYRQPSVSVASGLATNSYPNETEKMADPFHRYIIISLRTYRIQDIYTSDVPDTTSGCPTNGQKMGNNIPMSILAFSFHLFTVPYGQIDNRHTRTQCDSGASYPIRLWALGKNKSWKLFSISPSPAPALPSLPHWYNHPFVSQPGTWVVLRRLVNFHDCAHVVL